MKASWRALGGLYLILALILGGWLAWSASSAQAQDGCTELLRDGGFEEGGVWQLGITPLTPKYVTYARHSGEKSLALGITKGGNQRSFSSARQTVTIPASASSVKLSFWFYALIEGAATTDYMELVLLNPLDNTILDKPWYSRNDSRVWNQMAFDLSPWRGRTVQIYFNVYNDGLGGTAGMFLDDVSLLACPGAPATTSPPAPTATPTPPLTATPVTPSSTPTITPIVVTATFTPWVVTATFTPWVVTATFTPWVVTATFTPGMVSATSTPWAVTRTFTPPPGLSPSPTPVPTAIFASATPGPGATVTSGGCTDLLHNGGFEDDLAFWEPAQVALQVQGVTSPVHSGSWALRLGTQAQNLNSYSSVRQQVFLPASYISATLEFWTYTWSEPNAGGDYQELSLLDAGGNLVARLWRDVANEESWVRRTAPLIGYYADPIMVYFNVYNDGSGGRTAMFIDDVRLWVCGAMGLPTAAPGSNLPSAGLTPELTRVALAMLPTVTPTPWPTWPATSAQAAALTPAAASRTLPRFAERLPPGWQMGAAAAVTVLAILGLLWRRFGQSGPQP